MADEDISSNKRWRCVDCGVPVFRLTIRCLSCRGKHTRTIDNAICKQCKVGFRPRQTLHATFCSRECGLAWRWDQNKIERQVCRESKEKAREEEREANKKACVVCGAISDNKTCGEACRMEQARRNAREHNLRKHKLVERKCGECDSVFVPEYGNKHAAFCSDRCAKKSAGRTGKAKRRAKIRAVARESVKPFTVFDRDGWRCQICLKQTPRNRRGTRYSNAPELDHVVPLSRGGSHTYSNAQCACRSCNQEKSDKKVIGQRSFVFNDIPGGL